MLETVPRPALPPEQQPVAITIRVPRDVADQLRELAEREERSITWMASKLLREALAGQAKQRRR